MSQVLVVVEGGIASVEREDEGVTVDVMDLDDLEDDLENYEVTDVGWKWLDENRSELADNVLEAKGWKTCVKCYALIREPVLAAGEDERCEGCADY